jgi:xanthine dehydrogenase accessory factor
VQAEQRFVLATVVGGGAVGSNWLIDENTDEPTLEGLPPQAFQDAQAAMESGQAATRSYETGDGGLEIFFEPFIPEPKVVIVGASQIGQALCAMAKLMGYRVLVADARAAFITAERFPDADQLLKGWPQEVLPQVKFDAQTYVVLLSHDSKFDDPTLQIVLPSEAPYVGAIGSKRTQAERRERLIEQGVPPEQMAKLHGPVGLNLGGRLPEEIALSIMAEITAVRYGTIESLKGSHA